MPHVFLSNFKLWIHFRVTFDTILIKDKIQEDNPNATKHKHKPGRESSNDVLTIDSARKENNRSNKASGKVLGWADVRGLHDDVVDDDWYYH